MNFARRPNNRKSSVPRGIEERKKNIKSICMNIINLYTLPPNIDYIYNEYNLEIPNVKPPNYVHSKIILSFIKHYVIGLRRFNLLGRLNRAIKILIEQNSDGTSDITESIHLLRVQSNILQLYIILKKDKNNKDGIKKLVLDILYSDAMLSLIKTIICLNY